MAYDVGTMWIAGIVMAGVGALLVLGALGAEKRLVALRTAAKQTAQGLREALAQMTRELGAGAFSETCELSGTAECAQPLRAEISGAPCVYLAMRVEREYEETVREEGRERTRRGSETVAHSVQHAEFSLRDASGEVAVAAEGAEFDGARTCERFEAAAAGGAGLSLTMGGFSITLPAAQSGRRTLGHKVVEQHVPVGARLYVMAEAADRDGEVVLRRPKEGPFVVSMRSKEELVSGARSQARWMRAVGMTAIVGGVVLLAVGLLAR